MFGKEVAKRQRVLVDRISELPEFILHMILSVLKTKEACRASVLSKKWYTAWSTIPVLDFRPHYKSDPLVYDDDVEDEFGPKFVGYIDKVMQRYFEQQITIRKLHIECPEIDYKLACQGCIDKWIEIAVQNQVEELNIEIVDMFSPGYKLPEILFSAKSLKVLYCEKVNFPCYKTMKLVSLESLTLLQGDVDMDMLQRIISDCPLIDLTIVKVRLQQITLPWIGKANFKASSLRTFVYSGNCLDSLWSWNINVGALGNLRKVHIVEASITDDVVSQLASGLVALECLILSECVKLRCIKVSSISLKELYIMQEPSLKKATIDAPNLVTFWCNCQLEASISLITAQECFNVHFCPWAESIDTFFFTKLKEFLIETKFFKVLVICFSEDPSVEIEVEEEFLKNISTSPPFKLTELKLTDTDACFSEESTLTSFLDCLFWCCHPDVLTISTNFQNVAIELMLDILKKKVECWKHPLESIEVEGADLSTILLRPTKFEIKFKLSWKSFQSQSE